jgi:hypothetical protein
VLNLDASSRHFFLLLRLPCPGPGMLSVETEGNREKLVDWCWVLYNWWTGGLLDCGFCGCNWVLRLETREQ